MARSALSTKPKKKTSRATPASTKSINRKYLGGEPTEVTDSVASQARALTWYGYFHNTYDAKEWIAEYVAKYHPDLVDKFDYNNKNHENTYGWVAQMIMRGIRVPECFVTCINNHILSNIRKVKTKYVAPVRTEAETTEEPKPKDRLEEFIPDFEEAVDNTDKGFIPYNYLTSRNVPQIYVARIADYYQPVKAELDLAAAGRDKDVKESYRVYTKSEIKIMQKYVTDIIDQCGRFLSNAKKDRKPREPKVKTPAEILKHFRFMPSNERMQLTSINPASIIGAKYLFTLNTNNNLLTMFVAKEGGFSIHRSSITNWDEKQTISKRVGRTLKETTDQILNGNKRTRLSIMKDLKGTVVSTVDRINNHSILLLSIK